MIIVRVFGGLGNQMFQYAFGEYLRQAGNDVFYDLNDFHIHKHHQGYELENVFGLKLPEADKNEIKCITIDKTNLVNRILKKITKCDFIRRNCVFENCSIGFIENNIFNENLYFDGYWQNFKYIYPIFEKLKKDFEFKTRLSEKDRSICELADKYDLVSVHIRRGDYLKDPSISNICSKEYYHKAFSYIKQNLKNPIFIFFSDDINWCRNEFGDNEKNRFVDWNTGANSYRDMYLITQMNNHIISNSTFSWWGAVLSNRKGYIVAPFKWTNKFDSNLLLDSDWIGINNE